MSSTSRDTVGSLDLDVDGGGGGEDLGAASVAVAIHLDDIGFLEQLHCMHCCMLCVCAKSGKPYPVTKFGRVAARSKEEQRLCV